MDQFLILKCLISGYLHLGTGKRFYKSDTDALYSHRFEASPPETSSRF